MLAKKHIILLSIVALLHSFLTFLWALTRLYGYKASLFDSGLFDQLLWNMLHHGVPLTTENPPYTQQHWLGFHFSPLLILLLPFYAVWPYPETLQLVQSLCFAGAAIPLFYALQAAGAPIRIAWAMVMLYWINPFVISAAIWDFHEIAFAAPLMAVSLWALCAGRFGALLAALILLALTKEHYGVSIAGFGLLWGWRYNAWKQAAMLMVVGIIAAALILLIAMPHFRGGEHPMLSDSLSRYGWLSSPWEVKCAMLHTLLFGGDSPDVTGLRYMGTLLICVLFLPLLAPLYLAPAAADVLANLLSANPMPRYITAYHSAAAIPVFLLAAWQGYHFLYTRLPSLRTVLNGCVVAMVLILPVTGISTYPVTFWELWKPKLTHDTPSVEKIRKLIGEAAVTAQPNIGMFFSQRSAIYPFPHKLEEAEFVILHLAQPFEKNDNTHFGIPFGDTASHAEKLYTLLSAPGWHIAYWDAPWLVMGRGTATKEDQEERAEILEQIQLLHK